MRIRRSFLFAFLLSLAAPADAEPLHPDDVLLVGDSVTAGVWFMSLSQESAEQGWAGQLALRLGLEVDDLRLDGSFPVDHGALAQDGFGFLSLRYPWEAFPLMIPPRPLFEPHDERVILGLPGQLVDEFLHQNSESPPGKSAGWTFARLFLPPGHTGIETVEAWKKRPRWIVLFLGSNDALASLGIVGGAHSPTPAAFEADYEEVVRRLSARLSDDTPASHLLVLTLPDMTQLPLLQPVGEARDRRGRPLPAGTKSSAFLVPYRDRFHPDEVFTPAELADVHELVADYNTAIVRVGERVGATVVDLQQLIAEVVSDERFDDVRSPWFSPDLHHPSHRTHSAIAERVYTAMQEISRQPLPDHRVRFDPLPTNADYGPEELERVLVLNRLALLGLRAGPLPPDPTGRMALEIGATGGRSREGEAAARVLIGVESVPSPVRGRWLSRAALQGRAALLVLDDDELAYLPREGLELRLGLALERVGAWHWARLGLGAKASGVGGMGWYLRGEWRVLYADLSSRGVEPDRFEAGLRLGWLLGRPGHRGN